MPSTAEFSLPASFTPEKREELFEGIIRLYDLADDMMGVVAEADEKSRALQLELVNPVITQVTNSANILSAFYTEVARNGRPVTPDLQDTMEKAFSNIVYAFKDFIDAFEEKLLPLTKIDEEKRSPSAKKPHKEISHQTRTIGHKTLADKFRERPKKGALQNRLARLIEILESE